MLSKQRFSYIRHTKILRDGDIIEDVRSNSNETRKVPFSIFISYNLLLEGLEHE